MRHTCFHIAVKKLDLWSINGAAADDDGLVEYLNDRHSAALQEHSIHLCPHCGATLADVDFRTTVDRDEEWFNNVAYVAQRCPRCAYWEFNGTQWRSNHCFTSESFLIGSVAATFDPYLPDGCSEELAQQLTPLC